MSRSQQKDVYNTASANSKADQANAQGALGKVNADLDTYEASLGKYFSNDPYTEGGQFEKDQSNINAARANATSASVKDSLDRLTTRSGTNTSSYAPTIAATTQQATLDQQKAQADADAQRIGDETKYQQFGLEAEKFPVQAEEGVYGSSIGGANNALSTAEQAAKQPSIWDTLFQSAITGAAARATGGA